ncbi:MAG: acetyl-CoA acetyltransferase [Acidobacteria bacterium]|nr:acetyl-CoA acetyltransferase [Acidobacteriota bacterium]
MTIDPRTPVLVGVGVAQRPPDGSAGVSPFELMTEAATVAGLDSGATDLLGRLDTVAVTVGNWEHPDPGRALAEQLGVRDVRSIRVDVGVPQQTPVSVALRRIRSGAADVVLVAGGEALASRRAAERAGREAPDGGWSTGSTVPDEHWRPGEDDSGELMCEAEIAAGLWAPVEQYACIEVARGADAGWDRDQHLADIGSLWSAFDAVAGTNPAADFAGARSALDLVIPSAENRPLAWPYTKWLVSQWTVDQAAALLLCSAEVARSLGVPPDRWVFPRVALESSHAVSLTRRSELHRWPAMGVLGRAAAAHLGTPLDGIEVVECYSCFPSAVRVQQAELGLDPRSVPTLTGGMTFAGGPFNNATYQSTAVMVGRLRAEPDALGLLTTVSGLLTKPGLVVWSATPGPPELVADLAAEAAAATGTTESVAEWDGTGVVVTATAVHEGLEAVRAAIVADLPDGRRWVGWSEDRSTVEAVVTATAVGRTVGISGGGCSC